MVKITSIFIEVIPIQKPINFINPYKAIHAIKVITSDKSF